jgi:3-methyl-2-oxobutanoate hydroxymethyltransferase
MADMEHHVRAVARAQPAALVAADLPYRSYDTPGQAVASARRLIAAGAEAVKAEGGLDILPQVQALREEGIPYLGHLGMLPQHVLEEGGYHVKGKLAAESRQLLEDALALEAAGAFAVVLELVSAPVAAELTSRLAVPTIGIGAGRECDGQVLVSSDLFGLSPDYIPRHVKNHGNMAEQMRQWVAAWQQQIKL